MGGEPLLGNFGLVPWGRVLLEDVVAIRIVGLDPWSHLGVKQLNVLMSTNLEATWEPAGELASVGGHHAKLHS